MDDDQVSRGEVIRTLDKIQETVSSNPQSAQEHIFNAMNFFAQTFFEKKAQQGGGFPDFRPITNPSLVMPSTDLSDISIDKTYNTIKQKLKDLDTKNREIASIIGPVAYIHNMKHDPGFGPLPPYLPIRITIPKNSIIPSITYLTEVIKLLVSYGPLKSDFLRKLLSIALAGFDIINGEWKNGVLSLMGVAGSTPLLIGIIGRLIRQVWNFVSPDLQNELEDNLFAATKSVFAGFWLTMVSTFAPESLREMIDGVMNKLKQAAEMANKSLEQIEKAAQASARPLGLKVTFPRIPLEEVPSSDDLQNLLTILRRKEVICNPSTRSIIQPLLQQPVFRLLLELFNIPVTDEAVAEKCAGVKSNLGDAIAESIEPTISRITGGGISGASMTGGGAYWKTKVLKSIKDVKYIPHHYGY